MTFCDESWPMNFQSALDEMLNHSKCDGLVEIYDGLDALLLDRAAAGMIDDVIQWLVDRDSLQRDYGYSAEQVENFTVAGMYFLMKAMDDPTGQKVKERLRAARRGAKR